MNVVTYVDQAIVERLDVRAAKRPAHLLRAARRMIYPFVFVGLPTLLAIVYFGFLAAPVYVSESKFVVRFTSPPVAGAFTSFLQSAGITRSHDETYSVGDFLQSRDALRELQRSVPLRSMFSLPEADHIARFPRPWDSDSFEALFRYYGDRVALSHNSTSGITTLRTTAFRPGDAFEINRSLLQSASELLDRMNIRAREDAVHFSQREVAEAEQRLIDAQTAITTFRNEELMVDPARSSAAMLEMIGRLSGQLALVRARHAETLASAPDSTALPHMASRIVALEEQIEKERAKLVGNDSSIAPRISRYEQLVLRRELANKSLAAASSALDSARADARRRQLYLEPIVSPGVPEEAELPKRLKSIVIVFLVSSVSFLFGWLVAAAVRDYIRT